MMKIKINKGDSKTKYKFNIFEKFLYIYRRQFFWWNK